MQRNRNPRQSGIIYDDPWLTLELEDASIIRQAPDKENVIASIPLPDERVAVRFYGRSWNNRYTYEHIRDTLMAK